jgi:curved DNA-binding protein CbpA
MDDYDLLGVNKHASRDEIRRAYRQKIVRVHPDKTKSDSSDEFMNLTEAFNRIINTESLEQHLERSEPLANRYRPSPEGTLSVIIEEERGGKTIVERVYFHADNTVTREIVERR